MSNDTQTLTLSDFLLARIAEEEASLEGEQRPPSLHHIVSLVDPTRTVAERVLAECAAKRRIVEASSSEAIDAAFYAVPELPADDDWAHGAEWAFGFALRALAEPYADHPDFREEWRA